MSATDEAIQKFRSLTPWQRASRVCMLDLARSFKDPFMDDVLRLVWACCNARFHEARKHFDELCIQKSPGHAEHAFQTARKFVDSCHRGSLPQTLCNAIRRTLFEIDDPDQVPAIVAFMVRWFGSICSILDIVVHDVCMTQDDSMGVWNAIRDALASEPAVREELATWNPIIEIMLTPPPGKVFKYTELTLPDPERCCICLEMRNNVIDLECRHWICTPCVEEWIKKTTADFPTCPLCRVRLKINEVSDA